MNSREDENRHYTNSLEDYSPSFSTNIVDPTKNDIHESLKETVQEKIASFLQHLERNKREWKNRDDSSIYAGSSGIAFMYYFFGKQFNDESYIHRAVELIEQHSEDSKRSKRDITFLTGDAGRLALGAVMYYTAYNPTNSEVLISKLVALSDSALGHSDDELLYGRAGYLYALLFVNKNIYPPPIDDELIKKIIKGILASGKTYSAAKSCQSPLMYSWHDSEYLGGAHGLAGILYILLQAREFLTEQELKDYIKPSLEYVLSLQFPSGNFPSSVGNQSDKLVHWCHGAPSMTMVFILAHEVFTDERYLNAAKKCGEVVWTRGLLKKGCGICHGVSGNAYTFLSLYQKTQDLKYLYRACKFAEWCFDYAEHHNRIPDQPYSLFEGLAGIIYFLIDLTRPSLAKFPGYTL